MPPASRFRRRSVALLIETSNAYARGLLVGITAYLRHEPWSIVLPEQERGAAPPKWLARWKGDGIIARIENATIAREVMRLGVPVVDVSAARVVPSVPWVETNDAAIAELVFRHFVERGYRQFAFCGDSRFQWSRWRCERFAALAEAAGGECHQFQYRQATYDVEQQRLTEWLRNLPKPCGVMAAFDNVARQLLDACRDGEISVPGDVAVVGVDNDEVLCELCSPRLSSVAPDTFRTGLKAAELLSRMMDGEQVEPTGYFLEPLRLVARESSAGSAIADPQIAAGAQMIRDFACDGIQVADVVQQIGLSRRVFESRFQKLIGRTPHDEILRLKIEKIKTLLEESELPLADIAARTGFEHVEYLSVAFKRVVGVPPSVYRSQRKAR
jgi:LacI family transcriptional regulator